MSTKEQVMVSNSGIVDITPQAYKQIDEDDLFNCFARHLAGDWGELDANDWRANDEALKTGRRVLSRYVDRRGSHFWIVTEADRSQSTIFLPGEY